MTTNLKNAITTTIMAHLENWTEGAKFQPQCEQMADAVMEQIEQADTIATLTAERDRLQTERDELEAALAITVATRKILTESEAAS